MRTNFATKKSFWIVTLFYFFIAFEFFYMASPFAIYFYSVYKPGLNLINNISALSWLTDFFLPHISEDSKSGMINILSPLGWSFLVLGLFIFIVGASQVYYCKLLKKGAVTRGLYSIIRHPQYTGFILSSFGMLLIWPRYLVLISFITMLFVYFLLAKIEEKECVSKFGEAYTVYKNRTFMFLPFSLPWIQRIQIENLSRTKRIILYATFYLLSLFFSVVLANGIRKGSVSSLYVSYSDNTVNLSITKTNEKLINEILTTALNNNKVDSILKPFKNQPNSYFINYLLPADIFYISEIPMCIPQNIDCNFARASKDKNLIKVIFTRAIVDNNEKIVGKEILLKTKFTSAIVEVWINTNNGEIIFIQYPQNEIRYANIPVPVF
ncbi:MAG: isoprenylcysteine carboxylmethyltransferase family protein [Bacteroidota bacterium]|nr:MAG: isoprenylcysteine carboxylmethyltransferase family protein [Bacteroidota bacterium]